jgi:hypothetical protein
MWACKSRPVPLAIPCFFIHKFPKTTRLIYLLIIKYQTSIVKMFENYSLFFHKVAWRIIVFYNDDYLLYKNKNHKCSEDVWKIKPLTI